MPYLHLDLPATRPPPRPFRAEARSDATLGVDGPKYN